MDFVSPLDAANPGDEYVDENPSAGINGSIVPAEFFNSVQREILNVILAADPAIIPDAAVLTQLRDAILALIASGGGGGGGGVPTSRLINTIEGIQGGGDLTADRTLKLAFAGLAAAGALQNDDLVAIYDLANTTHKKITIADLAAALAGTVTVADTYTETDLALSGQTVTVNPLPASNERLIVSFQVVNTRYAPALLQAYCGGAWVTLASLAADTCLDPEMAPTIGGVGSIGLIHSVSASKLWVTGVPRRANLSAGIHVTGMQDMPVSSSSYLYGADPAVPMLGHGFNLAKLKSSAAWDGQLKIVSAGASITGVKKYSPLVIA